MKFRRALEQAPEEKAVELRMKGRHGEQSLCIADEGEEAET